MEEVAIGKGKKGSMRSIHAGTWSNLVPAIQPAFMMIILTREGLVIDDREMTWSSKVSDIYNMARCQRSQSLVQSVAHILPTWR